MNAALKDNGAQRSGEMQAVYGMSDFAGNFVLYHRGENNRCPSCNGNQWLVGRQTAECAKCACAVALASPHEPSPSIEEKQYATS